MFHVNRGIGHVAVSDVSVCMSVCHFAISISQPSFCSKSDRILEIWTLRHLVCRWDAYCKRHISSEVCCQHFLPNYLMPKFSTLISWV